MVDGQTPRKETASVGNTTIIQFVLFKLDSEILTDALLPQAQSKFLNLSPSLIALFTDEEDIFAVKVLKIHIILGY